MSTLKIVGAALSGAILLAGCATEDYVNKHVAVVHDQVTDLQGQVTNVQGTVQTQGQQPRDRQDFIDGMDLGTHG